MGTHPYQLDGYTPSELRAFLKYAEAKRVAMGRG
jgi:hypothetical protein